MFGRNDARSDFGTALETFGTDVDFPSDSPPEAVTPDDGAQIAAPSFEPEILYTPPTRSDSEFPPTSDPGGAGPTDGTQMVPTGTNAPSCAPGFAWDGAECVPLPEIPSGGIAADADDIVTSSTDFLPDDGGVSTDEVITSTTDSLPTDSGGGSNDGGDADSGTGAATGGGDSEPQVERRSVVIVGAVVAFLLLQKVL